MTERERQRLKLDLIKKLDLIWTTIISNYAYHTILGPVLIHAQSHWNEEKAGYSLRKVCTEIFSLTISLTNLWVTKHWRKVYTQTFYGLLGIFRSYLRIIQQRRKSMTFLEVNISSSVAFDKFGCYLEIVYFSLFNFLKCWLGTHFF